MYADLWLRGLDCGHPPPRGMWIEMQTTVTYSRQIGVIPPTGDVD